MNPIYYCYVYLDTRKPGNYEYGNLKFEFKPFYVGKGHNSRAYTHLNKVKRNLEIEHNHHCLRTIKCILLEKKEPIILFLNSNMQEEEAYNLEIKIIETIGLENLTNIFTGGKGGRCNKNFYGKRHTEESKEKMRVAHLGDKNPMAGAKYFRSENGKKTFSDKTSGEKHHYTGKKRDDSVKEKIKLKLTGYKWSDIEKKKRSEGVKALWKKRREGLVSSPIHDPKKNYRAKFCLIETGETTYFCAGTFSNFIEFMRKMNVEWKKFKITEVSKEYVISDNVTLWIKQ